MIGLTLAAVFFAWLAGFGMCYGAVPLKKADEFTAEDQYLGTWIGRFAAVAAIVFTILALTVTP